MASNFNYTLPIGRTDRGEGQRGQARGAWNEESGSMLGQHIKIMASIGADAPYIPIRGKGLRLISIASRYPLPGWKASASAHTNARTHARTHTRAEGIRPAVCSIAIFALLLQRLLPVPRFRPLEEERVRFLPSPFRCPHVNLSSDRTFSSAFSTQTCDFIEV